jgi:D-lactate dehydrogenase
MNILCYDPIKVSAMENIGAKYVDLDKLLKESDVISLHCPLTPESIYIYIYFNYLYK